MIGATLVRYENPSMHDNEIANSGSSKGRLIDIAGGSTNLGAMATTKPLAPVGTSQDSQFTCLAPGLWCAQMDDTSNMNQRRH